MNEGYAHHVDFNTGAIKPMAMLLNESSTGTQDNYTKHAVALARVHDIACAVNTARSISGLDLAVVTEPGAVYCRLLARDETLFVVNLLSGKMLGSLANNLPDEPTGHDAVFWPYNIWQPDPLESLTTTGKLVVAARYVTIKKILQDHHKKACSTTSKRYDMVYALEA